MARVTEIVPGHPAFPRVHVVDLQAGLDRPVELGRAVSTPKTDVGGVLITQYANPAVNLIDLS